MHSEYSLGQLGGTPLTELKPSDPIQRVHRLARDLAWGAVHDFWRPRMIMDGNHMHFSRSQDEKLFQLYLLTWERRLPAIHLLTAFGYLAHGQEGNVNSAILTEKAFNLLNQPLTEPSIFVSYRRQHSTPFALLVEARLRAAGNKRVFVDKMLEIGGDWQQELEQRVAACDYFIVLIGETTFESEWVLREVELAAEHGATIIPIWQPGVERNAGTPQVVNDRQEIRVERETAEAYETAISKLLHRLGYATY